MTWTEDQYREAAERAVNLRGRGRPEEAQIVFQGALDRARASGEEAAALYFGACLADLQNDHEREAALARQAAELQPGSALIVTGMGTALLNLGRHEEAIEWFDKALAIDPDCVFALNDRGAALRGLGRYEEAIEWYDKALAIDPDCILVLNNRSVALSELGRNAEAIDWYDKALAIRPDHLHALNNRGAALARLGRHEEAIEWYDKALAIRPKYASAQYNRAIALGLAGKTGEARQALQRYIEEHPDDERARTWLFKFSDAPQAQEEARQLEERSQRREHEAREQKIKLDAWRSLSARSAHRIGNQLFASRGAVRTLKELATGEGAEAVADMEGCLDRIRGIVQEFQAFSTNRPPKPKPCRIGPLLEDVVRRYRGLAETEGVKMHLKVAAEAPPCLLDREQMDQALGELLENAVHHVGSKGTVRVSAARAETAGKACVRVTIQDSGPGVAAKDKARIFEPFVTTRAGGSGLGLAIVRQIVENHEGTIRETGEAGKGARFEIDLPAATDEKVDP